MNKIKDYDDGCHDNKDNTDDFYYISIVFLIIVVMICSVFIIGLTILLMYIL